MQLLFLMVSVLLGGVIFWLSLRAQWNWGLGLLAAAAPVVVTLLLGPIGMVVAVLYASAMIKVLV